MSLYVPVVAACYTVSDHILLARREKSSNLSDYLEFPGGKVEEGETLEEALHREIREELNCSVKIEKLLHAQVNTYPPDPNNYLVLFYKVGLVGPLPLHTIWVHYTRLNQLKVLPGVREVVDKLWSEERKEVRN